MKLLGPLLSVFMVCLMVGQTAAQDSFSVFFMLRDVNNLSEGDEAQIAYFENRPDVDFIDLWDNARVRDDTAWLGLDPLQWANAHSMVWVDESVSSSRLAPIQDTESPIVNNENYACDSLGMIGPGADDDHGSPDAQNAEGVEIEAGTHFGTDLLIVDDTHPIAVGAGLANGVHTIYDDLGLGDQGGGRMSWCTPNEEARLVALIPGFEDEFPRASPIFVHEEGDEMADGRIAPGLRIGSFLSDTNRGPAPPGEPRGGTDGTGPGYEATLLTDAGWALVDSIVNYALGIPPDVGGMPCDFDSSGSCDIADLDELLYTGLGSQDAKYDLDGSGGEITLADRDAFLEEVGTFPGDFDLDGKVVAGDLNTLGGNWLKDDLTSYAQGDANGDGKADAGDLNALGSNWQKGAAAAAAVPEPNSSLLVMIGLLGLFAIRRRNR